MKKGPWYAAVTGTSLKLRSKSLLPTPPQVSVKTMPVLGGNGYIERSYLPGTHDEDWLLGLDEATRSEMSLLPARLSAGTMVVLVTGFRAALLRYLQQRRAARASTAGAGN